jgi:L-2-hydroxyglutarate oxidase
MSDRFDVVIVGGGVIGCATARALAMRNPSWSLCIVEKEADLALHQSGRNSGVVHAGYNQKPGSLKARFVVEGSKRLRAYCRERGIALVEDGILIVGKGPQETTLRELMQRGQANGTKVEWVDRGRLRELEPAVEADFAVRAVEGASFDARSYVKSLAAESKAVVRLGERVVRAKEGELETTRGVLQAGVIVNAGGLHADRLAHMMGVERRIQIVPFRGEYWEMVGAAAAKVRSHVYPCPDLRYPFLGVHLSRTFDQRVIVGPSATLVPGREAYGRFSFRLEDVVEMARWRGFRRLVTSGEFWRLVRREWRKTVFLSAVVEEVREMVPSIGVSDVVRGRAGIRAQAVDEDGKLVDDLVIEETARSVHALNAVSPALTCSLPFAEEVAARVAGKLA